MGCCIGRIKLAPSTVYGQESYSFQESSNVGNVTYKMKNRNFRMDSEPIGGKFIIENKESVLTPTISQFQKQEKNRVHTLSKLQSEYSSVDHQERVRRPTLEWSESIIDSNAQGRTEKLLSWASNNLQSAIGHNISEGLSPFSSKGPSSPKEKVWSENMF